MVKDNIDVAKHLIEGKLEFVIKTPDDLAKDEGDIVLNQREKSRLLS